MLSPDLFNIGNEIIMSSKHDMPRISVAKHNVINMQHFNDTAVIAENIVIDIIANSSSYSLCQVALVIMSVHNLLSQLLPIMSDTNSPHARTPIYQALSLAGLSNFLVTRHISVFFFTWRAK